MSSKVIKMIHFVSIISLIFLGFTISFDTFHNTTSLTGDSYMKIQLIVSIILLITIALEFFLTKEKKKYLKMHFLFILVCIPYLNIFQWLNIGFSQESEYFLRFIPMLRGGYILGYFVNLYCKRKASQLLVSYLLILVSILYFFSLIFYIFEYKINPDVSNYGDALWWSTMVASTEGSNIVAVTSVGRILTVIEVFIGITFFPVFTVYIIDLIKRLDLKDK